MSELSSILPQEVVDFVAECRRKRFAPDAEFNFRTGNPYERGFTHQRDGLYFLDTSFRLDNPLPGVVGREYVTRLDGKPFYLCQYSGSRTEHSGQIGQLVDEVQNRLMLENPTLIRFRSPEVSLWLETPGHRFNYSEFRISFPWGVVSQERLSLLTSTKPVEVYCGSSQITIF